jgi:hypothetical protein
VSRIGVPLLLMHDDPWDFLRASRCGRRFLWPDESAVGAERVDVDACQSQMGGLVTAGPWVRVGAACWIMRPDAESAQDIFSKYLRGFLPRTALGWAAR